MADLKTHARAYELGAKFDGWSEHFKFDIWKQAMEDCGIDGEFYAYRERSYEEVLPWDFIDIGVKKQFLIDENEKAKAALTSARVIGASSINSGLTIFRSSSDELGG